MNSLIAMKFEPYFKQDQSPPPKFAIDGSIICPACECEMTHLSAVVLNQDGKVRILGKEGTVFTDGNKNYGRGSEVGVMMFCESGHTFEVRFSFHKGSVFVESYHTGDYDIGETWTADPPELWRD